MGYRNSHSNGYSDTCTNWRNPIKIKKPRECGSIIFNRELNKILLVNGRLSKKWGIPKGHCFDNESNIECSIRETYEETGLKFTTNDSIKNKIGNPIHFYVAKIYVIIFIVDESIKINPIDSNEIIDHRWFLINDIYSSSQSNLSRYYNSSVRLLNDTSTRCTKSRCTKSRYKTLNDILIS